MQSTWKLIFLRFLVKFTILHLFQRIFPNYVMMTRSLRNFISSLLIVSIIKMIYIRLQLDWGVTRLFLAIKSWCPYRGKRRSKGKNHEFHFRLELDLHFYFHVTFTFIEYFAIFDNIDQICNWKYKNVTNGTELSRKHWVGSSFWLYLWRLKTRNFRFFDFRRLISYREKGVLNK